MVISGTPEGFRKAKETIAERYGHDENGKSLLHKRVGAIGGSVKGVKKGFALMSPEARSAAGKKGGAISVRGKAKKTE